MKTILLLGDSLIAWGDWESLLSSYTVINRGIAGEDVEGLSVRLTNEATAAEHPDYIHIMAGTNNLLAGNHFFSAIFRTMLPRMQHLWPQAIITMNAMLPMRIAGLSSEIIDRVNLQLSATAKSNNTAFLNLDSAFSSRCLPITHPCFLEDGVHLSTRGYQVWADAICLHLETIENNAVP